MAAPTFVTSYDVSWSTSTTPKTVSVTTQAGDRVLVVGVGSDQSVTLGTPTGNSLTYTLVQEVNVAAYCRVYAWTATDAAGGTNWTLSVTRGGSAYEWGFTAFVFRDSDGFGASSKTNASGAPSLAITTTQDDSAIVCVNGDWEPVNGATRTWRTINGITPTAANQLERHYAFVSGSHTGYDAYWNDAGAAGSKTTGLSLPTGQAYGIINVEVKGSAGGGAVATPGPIVAPPAAVVRASTW